MSTLETRQLVSVIIAVRNGENFLAEAIRSVQAQTYSPFEVLVVDGHSTDRTADIARSFKNLRWLVQPGHGLPDALNFGISEARGNWIAFLEHDDLWLPEKLREQIQFMETHPELGYTLTKTELFLEPGTTCPRGFLPAWFEQPQLGAVLSSFVARKDVFRAVGLFDTQWQTAGDMDWFARAKDKRVATAYLPQALIRKRIHGSNLTAQVGLVHAELLQVLRRKLNRKQGTQEAQT